MKQIVIACDVDDVVAELVSWWLHLYNHDWNDNLRESDIKSWNISEYTKCENRIYDYLKEPSLYDCVLPVIGAFWGIRRLKGLGFRIIYVTSSPIEQAGRKYKWLKDYGFITSRIDYVECSDKSLIYADYLIDDAPVNINSFKGQSIIYNRQWNLEMTGYPRVNDWNDVVEYFIKVKQEREITGV